MMRRLLLSLLIVISLSIAGCGLRGDLYIEEPGQPNAEPAVNPAMLDAAEDELDVTGISAPDILETEEEASADSLDDGVEAP